MSYDDLDSMDLRLLNLDRLLTGTKRLAAFTDYMTLYVCFCIFVSSDLYERLIAHIMSLLHARQASKKK